MRTFFCVLTTVFVLVSASAQAQYAFRIGDTSFDAGRGIAADADGNVFVTGWFAISGDFDPGPGKEIITVDGFFDAFVASYDIAGNYRWAFSIPVSNSTSQGMDLAVASSGSSIAVGGWLSSSADFDPDPDAAAMISAPCGGMGAFVASYSTAGQYRWAFPLGGCLIEPLLPGVNYTSSVVSTADDGLLATGALRGEADLDPGPGEAPFLKEHGHAIFLASYDADGDFRWGFQIGDDSGGDIGEGSGVAADSGGGAVAVGVLWWPADFDPDPVSEAILTPTSIHNAFVASYDGSGAYRWAFNLGPSPSEAWDVAIDKLGNVYVTGDFDGTVDFDPNPDSEFVLTATDTGNGFIASYDGTGAFRWAIAFSPEGGGSEARALALDPGGDVTVVGRVNGSIDFDPGPGVTILSGTIDAFLASYTTEGAFRWASVLDSPDGYALPRSVAALLENRWVMAGDLYGTTDFDPGPEEHLLTSAGPQPDLFSDIFVAAYADGGGFPVASEPEGALPTHFALEAAYPNPFNPQATIPFALPEAARVTLTVYDVLGRHITTLADGLYEAGRHTAVLEGSRLASGVYLVQAVMQSEGGGDARNFVQRLTLLR